MNNNIYSKSNDILLASLTNPTEIAVYYKKLTATTPVPSSKIWKCYNKQPKLVNNYSTNLYAYPIKDTNGEWYADVESAYQRFKGKVSEDNKILFMTKLLVAKLEIYPNLVELLTERGGSEYIKTLNHIVYGTGWWEGKGLSSPFIQALYNAYQQVTF